MNEWRDAYENLVYQEIRRLSQAATAEIISRIGGLTFAQQKAIVIMGEDIVANVKNGLKKHTDSIDTPAKLAASAHAFYSVEAHRAVATLFENTPAEKTAQAVFADAVNNLGTILKVKE